MADWLSTSIFWPYFHSSKDSSIFLTIAAAPCLFFYAVCSSLQPLFFSYTIVSFGLGFLSFSLLFVFFSPFSLIFSLFFFCQFPKPLSSKDDAFFSI
ncbi:hypothetical protein BC940DRAFT_51409 [Gongronella butleri]|nr:hypothetical protein BC940DRAFT_51409 [Gongronella butleri]